MSPAQYTKLIEQRGGKRTVSTLLNVTHSAINRRCSGQSPITREMELAIESIPVHPHWDTLAKLKRDKQFRNAYRQATLAMPYGADRQNRITLLAEAAAGVPGRKVSNEPS